MPATCIRAQLPKNYNAVSSADGQIVVYHRGVPYIRVLPVPVDGVFDNKIWENGKVVGRITVEDK